jgi:hypothetical protein
MGGGCIMNQEMKYLYQVLVGIPKQMRPFRNRHDDRKLILKWTLKNRVRGCGLDSTDSG